jgi:formate dehydrogenase subunit gamma
MSSPPPDIRLAVERLVAAHRHLDGALLPILHAIQEELGFVPDDGVELIAQGLNLSRAEVHGVITYYHHFRRRPPARHVVQVCRAESCQSCGANELIAHAERKLGCAMGQARADGEFALEPVYCLGLCASSPAICIGDRLHGRMTPERFDTLVDQAKETA